VKLSGVVNCVFFRVLFCFFFLKLVFATCPRSSCHRGLEISKGCTPQEVARLCWLNVVPADMCVALQQGQQAEEQRREAELRGKYTSEAKRRDAPTSMLSRQAYALTLEESCDPNRFPVFWCLGCGTSRERVVISRQLLTYLEEQGAHINVNDQGMFKSRELRSHVMGFEPPGRRDGESWRAPSERAASYESFLAKYRLRKSRVRTFYCWRRQKKSCNNS
jgi:hypothetical protein